MVRSKSLILVFINIQQMLLLLVLVFMLSNRRKIVAITMQLKQMGKESLKKNSGLNGIPTHGLCEAGALHFFFGGGGGGGAN